MDGAEKALAMAIGAEKQNQNQNQNESRIVNEKLLQTDADLCLSRIGNELTGLAKCC